jgi:mycothiol synthase
VKAGFVAPMTEEHSRIEPVPMPGLADALGRLLAPDPRTPATPQMVAAYLQYMETSGVSLRAYRARRPESPATIPGTVRLPGASTDTILGALRLPGATALVLFPPNPTSGSDVAEGALIRALSEDFSSWGLRFAQASIEPQDDSRRGLLHTTGFRLLTTLVYLRRIGGGSPSPAKEDRGLRWLRYDAGTHDAFGETILATHAESLDCPELNGLRGADEIIASHQAVGPFDPSLWELAQVDGRYAGCVLLSRAPFGSMLELVYMGVRPGFRKRGLGAALVERATAHGDRLGVQAMTVVVDERNAPAWHLYLRAGFTEALRRDVYLWTDKRRR